MENVLGFSVPHPSVYSTPDTGPPKRLRNVIIVLGTPVVGAVVLGAQCHVGYHPVYNGYRYGPSSKHGTRHTWGGMHTGEV